MEIIQGLNKAVHLKKEQVSLALGNFDGVHRGHAKIIEECSRAGKIAGALIFDPHPMKVLFPEKDLKLITTLEERIALLHQAGLDFVVVEPFTARIAALSPLDFVTGCLQKHIAPKQVVVGFDYTFGSGGSGKPQQLLEMGRELGFSVTIVPPVSAEGVVVGSTIIRELLKEGKIETANRLLGHAFTRRGKVVRGEGRGKTLGFPTLNLPVDENLCYPRNGVYLVKAGSQKNYRWGVANMGCCPTFNKEQYTLEVHLLEQEGTFYNTSVEVMFLNWIREEKKFPDAGSLARQIGIDIQRARELIMLNERETLKE